MSHQNALTNARFETTEEAYRFMCTVQSMLNDPRFAHYCAVTDQNYTGGDCTEHLETAVAAIDSLVEVMDHAC